MRRSPYSTVDVNQVDVQSLAKGRAGQRCIVGVDVGKQQQAACCYWSDRSFDRPWCVKAPEQIGLLVEKLKQLGQQVEVEVALESSGTYGDVLRAALAGEGIKVKRVSAKAVKDHSETFDGVPSQHDGKDAAVIAELAWLGKAVDWPWQQREEKDAAMRYWVRRLDTAQRVKQMYCGKLEALLARHWPEVGRLLKQSGATLPRALAHWGEVRAIAADAKATQILQGLGGRLLKIEKIQAVIESARSSAGVAMNVWEVREMQDIAQRILQQRREIATCKAQLRQLARDNPVIAAQSPAVGRITACVLWVCLGDVRQYHSAGAYRKAMGLNLKEHSSGQYKGQLRISKRGQRLSRKWLYFSALRHMRDPRVKQWTARKKARDQNKAGRAAVAVMRRLALATYHIGKHGVAFEAGRLFADSPRPAKRSAGKRVTRLSSR